MSVPKHYHDFVRLNPEKVEYKGNKEELTEYTIDKIIFCSLESGTKLVFEVTLGRPLMSSILTIYIPTLLLLVISLVAQVFANEFPDMVVQVNLTVLLVLASFFIGISQSILATSYVKWIDVWMIFVLAVPFLEVVLLAIRHIAQSEHKGESINRKEAW